MVSSTAKTVADYLAELPPERARELEPVLTMVRDSVPEGIAEGMGFGMIAWTVPLEVYPDTYNKQPLMYAALAAQKAYSSLYVMSVYAGARLDKAALRARWAGDRKLDMGGSCVRFRSASDLDLPLLGEALSQCTMADFVQIARAARAGRAAPLKDR